MIFTTNCVFILCVLQACYAGFINHDTNTFKSYKKHKVYVIDGPPGEVAELITNLAESYNVPVYEKKGSTAQILVPPELVEDLEGMGRAAGLKMRVKVEDVSKLMDLETVAVHGQPFNWTCYFDIDDINEYLRNTSLAFPDSTELIEGGQSYENRKILGLRINTYEEGHKKPVIFIESGIHAREWIAPATTTYFINQLLTSKDQEIQNMRNQFDWRIFPSINPDGYHYSFVSDRMWRKTRSKSPNGCRGADPNRNWDYNWDSHTGSTTDPCNYEIYAGSKPFSEVETRSLSEYISKIENLQAYIGFHSFAQILLLPFSDSKDHVDNYDDLVKIGKTSLDYGKAVNGEIYDGPGTAAEILYAVSGGSMDWVRSYLNTPLVYTYELRGNSFHWPASRIHEQGDEVTQMLLGLVKEAKNMGYLK